MSARLMLHAGAQLATLAEVAAVRMPDATKTYQPIPHIDVRNLVVQELASQGLRVVEEEHGLFHGGARYFGVLTLRNGDNQPDYALAAGIRNSHDKRFPGSLAIGSRVFVCDNLAFSGEITISRKHTRFIGRDFPGLVNRACGLLGAHRVRLETRIRLYKATEIQDTVAHDVAIHALDSQVVPVTALPAVLAEWRKPTHEEFAARTAWSLFNAFTEVLKGTSPFELGKRTIALHGIMDRLAGVTLAQDEESVD